MVGLALRENEFGLLANLSAHVVKTRAYDSKCCVRASEVKFQLSARPIISLDYRRRFSTARTSPISEVYCIWVYKISYEMANFILPYTIGFT